MTLQAYYEEPGITIYCGDALELLPSLVGAGVNTVLTDPPFGVREDEAWDDMTAQEFARFSMAWLSQARRVSDELIVFATGHGQFRTICDMLYPRVRVMVWDKPKGSQYAGSAERGLWFAFEAILHGYRPERREFVTPKALTVGGMIRKAREAAGLSRGAVDTAVRGKKTGLCYRWEEGACLPTHEQARQLASILGLDGPFTKALGAAYDDRDATLLQMRQAASEDAADGRDVFSYRTETNVLHPCQKPLGLMQELIHRMTNKGDLILDPFCGSGTTLRAAKDTGRRCIGIEREEKYAEIAVKRLAQNVLSFGE